MQVVERSHSFYTPVFVCFNLELTSRPRQRPQQFRGPQDQLESRETDSLIRVRVSHRILQVLGVFYGVM